MLLMSKRKMKKDKARESWVCYCQLFVWLSIELSRQYIPNTCFRLDVGERGYFCILDICIFACLYLRTLVFDSYFFYSVFLRFFIIEFCPVQVTVNEAELPAHMYSVTYTWTYVDISPRVYCRVCLINGNQSLRTLYHYGK